MTSLGRHGRLFVTVVLGILAVTELTSRTAQGQSGVDPKDCTTHLGKCLDTELARPDSGGKWGYSVCRDCFDYCRGQEHWPDRNPKGDDCQWWNHGK
jgi:hypothetical protein